MAVKTTGGGFLMGGKLDGARALLPATYAGGGAPPLSLAF